MQEIKDIDFKQGFIPVDTNYEAASIVEDLEEFAQFNANMRVSLTNFRELQYYGPLFIGSPRQKLNFVYDTGSSWLWFPTQDCNGCPTKKHFNPANSVTYNETTDYKELFYGKGHVTGKIIYDTVALLGVEVPSVTLKMLAVNEAEDLAGTQADGILGLSPKPSTGAESLVQKLADGDIIDSKEFTVFIGPVEETSYVDFGKYKGNLENVTWTNLINTQYWAVNMNSMSYKDSEISFDNPIGVLDTGTSILGFPRKDLVNIFNAIREERQLYYLENIGFYGVKCQSISEFYDLTININGHITRIPAEEFLIQTGGY